VGAHFVGLPVSSLQKQPQARVIGAVGHTHREEGEAGAELFAAVVSPAIATKSASLQTLQQGLD
jgi:hypothetical protein